MNGFLFHLTIFLYFPGVQSSILSRSMFTENYPGKAQIILKANNKAKTTLTIKRSSVLLHLQLNSLEKQNSHSFSKNHTLVSERLIAV